ncbi:1,4-alpha-glucan branching protein GlgB [Acidiphilium acidophilum]|uniref:1,4-alpha-glucan branching protein GlgB n=1 Tax=Acidiphilium acidophilum TaxID=76588 RepID=UPI002E8E6759|nr:1,4-alpha-glucan branching protein GlgB [Acidiphilium acidophilum]
MPAHDDAALDALANGTHGDPFAILGPHRDGEETSVTTFQPGAGSVTLLADGHEIAMTRIHPAGIFRGTLPGSGAYRLRVGWDEASREIDDPYRFATLLSEYDVYLLAEGRQLRLTESLGATPATIEGVSGVRFAVWAPNARRVSVVGAFNLWDGRRHPMRKRYDIGVWELFIPEVAVGSLYKYEILAAHGGLLLKADPLARQVQGPPETASIVADAAPFAWHDEAWMSGRDGRSDRALSVYEVHAASWRRHDDGSPLLWGELAEQLIPYVTALGFTHIEFMPVMAHPFGGSWGYQPLSQFAPMPALGTPAEFASFVDRCHQAGVGVILDWVPAHFPTDAFGLAQFDGTPLYEHADPREGFHQDWNTLIYNLGRNEVRNFLIASALFWLDRYHVDGIRVDAVASMLYRDYSRKEGEWIPNRYGGRENLEAIDFLKELSGSIEIYAPGAMLIAEESTAWPGVTRPVADGGLGFSHKWNMGWMHDTLRYIEEDPINRRYHHDEMTFGLVYAFSERFVLPISHDEVVYGKHSLIGKMPGDRWQKFANLRAYLSFMWTQPGKKLLFMGQEFGQTNEWNHDATLNWGEADQPEHDGLRRLIGDLNRIYRREPALSATDFDPAGFRWIVGDDRDQSIFAWQRQTGNEDETVVVLANFTPVPRSEYRIGVPFAGRWREVFNSDSGAYGGSDLGNLGGVASEAIGQHGVAQSIVLTVPPLGVLILRRDS